MVLNALDNLGKKSAINEFGFFFDMFRIEARRHVNAMCLAADIPLVESGTEGYFGQTYIIKKVKTTTNEIIWQYMLTLI